jgi:hypothetical protein
MLLLRKKSRQPDRLNDATENGLSALQVIWTLHRVSARLAQPAELVHQSDLKH